MWIPLLCLRYLTLRAAAVDKLLKYCAKPYTLFLNTGGLNTCGRGTSGLRIAYFSDAEASATRFSKLVAAQTCPASVASGMPLCSCSFIILTSGDLTRS